MKIWDVRATAMLVIFLACLSIAGAGQTTPPAKKIIAVKAARVIDGLGGAPLSSAVILIENDHITAVGSRLAIPPGAEVIDLGSDTILPGFIDCHTHITGQPGENFYEDLFKRSPLDDAVMAHLYARRTLEAGFTTIRDVGSEEYVDVALKKAINHGDIPGPRLLVAGLSLSATGGHGDLSGYSPYLSFKTFSGIADGVDQIRKLVRTNVRQGADVIKVLATAGVLSEEDSVGAPQVLTGGVERRRRGSAHVGAPRGRTCPRRRGHQARDPRRREFRGARLVHR